MAVKPPCVLGTWICSSVCVLPGKIDVFCVSSKLPAPVALWPYRFDAVNIHSRVGALGAACTSGYGNMCIAISSNKARGSKESCAYSGSKFRVDKFS